MKTPTLQQFKTWSKLHRPLAEAVCMAQAFAECERERVDAYIQPIFDSFNFMIGEKMGNRLQNDVGERITDPKQLYLCTDETLCAQYYAACDVAHRAHGFTGKPGYCPALIAEDQLRKAQHALIDAGCKLMDIDPASLWDMKNRDKMLDLLLGACLKKDERRAA